MEATLRTTNMYLSLLTAVAVSLLCADAQPATTITATCQIDSLNATNKTVSGLLTLSQPASGGYTSITGNLTGFTWGGLHGFHVHKYGNLSDQCIGAGGHFNPYNKSHGGQNDTERHLGDLGNIFADANLNAYVNITDYMIKLGGNYNVSGLAIVVHANEDDLGKGNSTDSKSTGNSGYRIGCCVITLVNQTTTATTVPPVAPTTTSRGSPVSDRPLATVLVLCLVALLCRFGSWFKVE